MASREKAAAVTCDNCGEVYTLPEDDTDGNLPRVLHCGHIFCTSCLLSLQSDSIIKCPECEVNSTLPEGGVHFLPEDTRIVGLIYKTKSGQSDRSKNHRRNEVLSADLDVKTEQPVDIKDVERTLDEALVQAAENLEKMKLIHQTLTAGQAEQVKKEQTRLAMEINQVVDKSIHAIKEWSAMQLNQVSKLEVQSSASVAGVSHVQDRIKALEMAMKMAREVRRIPFLGQYCSLDNILEILRAPVDKQTVSMKTVTMETGMSCVLQSEYSKQSLELSLKLEFNRPKQKSPLHWAEVRKRNSSSPRRGKLPSPKRQEQDSCEANWRQSSSQSPPPCHRPNLSLHGSNLDVETPDVVVEELVDVGQQLALPARGRIPKRRRNVFVGSKRANVTQWVVVTHIVNPNHFYVCYMAERRDSEVLSKRIQQFCSQENCFFTSSDSVETGSSIFVKWKEGLWCRANVVEILQSGCEETVKTCKVTQLASVQVFLLENGLTENISIEREEETPESSLNAVNSQLRKVVEAVNVELGYSAPQAVRCSLKDLVPYDPIKGWSKEAQVEFSSLVGLAAVEMRPFGQDRDSLLVDLKKVPMDQSNDTPISAREYLVYIEVARFHCPVKLGQAPLLLTPPVYPSNNTARNAVVSHINNPADFYVQLVDTMESLLLSKKLQECYDATPVAGKDDLSIHSPSIGQVCVARYDDSLWYRAQVVGHSEGTNVEVLFVDFGNIQVVSVSDLRRIKDEFFALPSMAIHCCLSGVIPLDGESWSDTCTKRFISLAHEKLLTIVATGRKCKTGPVSVKLLESRLDGPQTIAEQLVTEGLASFTVEYKLKHATPPDDDSTVWDPPLEHSSATEDLESSDQQVPQEEELFEFQLPPQLKDVKVKVTHINSPSSFYVQLAHNKSQLKRVSELLKQECGCTEPQDVEWKVDMFCAAHINGVWERGQICSDITSNIAEVIRCDHGNTEEVHVSSLRPLPAALTGSLAVECSVTDIRPAGGRSTWTATACDLFAYYLMGASAVMTVKGLTDQRPLPVILFCSNKMGQFVSIAEFLTNKGLALRERKPRDAHVKEPEKPDEQSPLSKTQTQGSDREKESTSPPPDSLVSTRILPKPAPPTVVSAEKVQTLLYDPPQLPCLGLIQTTVCAIGEDGLIFTRTKNAECQLEQLNERIQQSIKTLPAQKPYTWKSVQGCAVFGPDMSWCRGRLLEVLGGNVEVQYVDYGHMENIPVVHVYPMLLCEDVPQLCVPCLLHATNPIGGRWQPDALALLKDMLLNRCVEMHVTELPSDPREPLTVQIFMDGMSLSRILCSYGHATMDKTVLEQGCSVTPPVVWLDDWEIGTEGLKHPEELMLGSFINPNLPQKGERFEVRVKHLRTPNEVFLWPLEETVEVDGEKLDEALARINEDVTSLQQLTHFPFGAPCLAEYSDGKFYRALLKDFTSLDPLMIMVQHVDYGSEDALPASKLRQMPPELLKFPLKALKVKVAGFKPPSVNREDNVLPYSPSWSVKAALEMVDLLNNITASVVAHEPELTVLLYNEDGELVHLPLVSSGLAELE